MALTADTTDGADRPAEVTRRDDERATRYRNAEAAMWRVHGATAVSERWFSVASTGTRIRVLEHGDGPPVLFVHGGPNAGSAWAPVAARVGTLRSIVLDRPGCGLSEPLSRIDRAVDLWEAMVDVQATVIREVAGGPADVVASSFGGACALQLARARPDLVRRLVLEGAPVVEGLRINSTLRVLAAGPIGRFIAGRRATRADLRRTFRQLGHAELVDAGWPVGPDLDWSLSLMNDTLTMANDVALIQRVAGWRGFRSEWLFPVAGLAAVSAPTLWLWGGSDPFGTVELGEAWARLMPRATFEVIEGAGHLPWLDDPAWHAARIDALLGDVD
jgi:2-hydroxy-6-oxonona-2,4-dienedioate hydrolase